MQFSIIIPTFNRADLLNQAIRSALSQTHTDREVLIVDDGSSDDTAAVASHYGAAVRYLRQENQGKAAALNRGIAAAGGDVIAILDDDDCYPRWALAKHAEALTRNPAADFSYGRYVRFTGADWPSASNLQDEEDVPLNDPRRLSIRLMERCFIPNPAWAVRKKAQLLAGPYNENLKRSQDYDMILRLARRNEGAFVNEIVLLQRQHEAYRGPTSERVLTIHTIQAWLKYDAILFGSIDRDWNLSDFRPLSKFSSSVASPSLQKGVILFQRKVYDGAQRALREYRRELEGRVPSSAEQKIASSLLGCRYGIDDLATDSSLRSKVARSMRAEKWPMIIRMAFASQIRWRFRSALTGGNFDLAFGLIRFSGAAFGISATLAMLGSRFSGGAQSWRTPQVRLDALDAAPIAVDMALRLDNANALPTYSQPQQKQQKAA